jgi:hypothetical protein
MKSIERLLDNMPDSIDPAQLGDHQKISSLLEAILKHKGK